MANDANKSTPITVNGKRLLEEEIRRLLTVERPAVVKAIEEARAHGDLKENAEYAAAKERQGFIEGRIGYINAVMANSQVIDPSKLNFPHVVFGATVDLTDTSSGKEVTYQLVGVDEADIAKGKISINSPVARALLGKKEGDEVTLTNAKGTTVYEVVGVEYK